MSAVLSVALRYLLRRPTALLAAAMTALSIASLLWVMSVLWGMEHELVRSARTSGADISIRRVGSRGWGDYAWLAEEILGWPGVAGCTPIVEQVVLLEHRGEEIPATLRGWDWGQAPVLRVWGEDSDPLPAPPGERDAGRLFPGRRLQASAGLFPGDEVTVWAPVLAGASSVTTRRMGRTTATVGGAFRTGDWVADETVILTDLATAQRILGLGAPSPAGLVHRLAIRTSGDDATDSVLVRLRGALGRDDRYVVETWRETHHWIAENVAAENAVMVVILCIVLVSSAFGIALLLLMIVREKRRDIGILKTVGFTTSQVAGVFVALGSFVGVAGTGVGALAGVRLAPHLDAITNWISLRLTGEPFYFARAYYLERLPCHIDSPIAVRICLFMLVLSVLAALVPAILAARQGAVRSLRSE